MGIVCAGAVLLYAVPAEAAFPGGNGRIAYESGDAEGIFSVWPDGTGRLRVVRNDVTQPVYAPSGRRIAFSRLFDKRFPFGTAPMSRIEVVGADGRGGRRLTGGDDFSPSIAMTTLSERIG
jgi:hypothetical protein